MPGFYMGSAQLRGGHAGIGLSLGPETTLSSRIGSPCGAWAVQRLGRVVSPQTTESSRIGSRYRAWPVSVSGLAVYASCLSFRMSVWLQRSVNLSVSLLTQ
jgi:hypothetical protein